VPWHVEKSDSCPDSKQWAVIKDSDGSVVGCHKTKSAANKQLAALNASENSGSKVTEKKTPLIDFRTFKIEVRAKSPEGLPTEVEGKVLTYNKVDAYGTRWKKGSIIESIERRLPPFLWAHSVTEPIGRATDFSDHRDHFRMLFRLDDPNFVPRARQAAYQIKEGTIDEFSVGFTRVETKYLDPEKEKDQAWEEMVKANVVETSIVPYGAVPDTAVVGMRALFLPEEYVREVITMRQPNQANNNGNGDDEQNDSQTGNDSGETGQTGDSETTTEEPTAGTEETHEEGKEGATEPNDKSGEETPPNNDTDTTPKETVDQRSSHTFVRKVTDGHKSIKIVESKHEEGSLSSIMQKRKEAREAKEKAAREAESLRIAEAKQVKEAKEADKLAHAALASRKRNDYMSSIRGRRR
jgi:uncharacterized protein